MKQLNSSGEAGVNVDRQHELSIALRKVSVVLLPMLFICGTLAYIDKGNLSYAAVKLNAQLGLSPVDYGLGSGLFYLGFAVGILPSTYMTMRYGARRWLGFITLSWGVISACHALLNSKTSFFVLRALLGLAEAAGSSSGGHLLAQFYPKSKRAIPFTVVIVSTMVSGVFAAPLAAGLMSLDGTGGLSGWQWLFLIEGIPSVILGICMMVWLPSHPLTAWMLTPSERELLHTTVHETPEDADAARQPPRIKQLLPLLWDAARRPILWFFVAVAFLWTLSFMSLYQWLPILINNMLSGTALSGSTSSGISASAAKGAGPSPQATAAILLSGVPPVCGSVAMLIVAWHSDRVDEKNWHVAIPYVVSGVVLTLFTPFYKLSFAGGFAVLVISLTLSNCSQGVYNSRVVACLDTRHVGIGLALYTAVCGILAGFTGPLITGAIVQKMGSFSLATIADGVLLIAAGLLMTGLAFWEKWGGGSSRNFGCLRHKCTADDRQGAKIAAQGSEQPSYHDPVAKEQV